jgi:hypothetical protein
MISLKTYIPTLAYALNLTPAALYERQRVLVREGLLVGSTGHGPGTGVAAIPSSVACLVVAALATDSLSEIKDSVTKLASAEAQDRTCPLTGTKDFGQALTNILANSELAERISSVNVVRSTVVATVYYQQQGRQRIEVSRFGLDPAMATLHVLTITASLPGSSILRIARDLKWISAGVKGAVFREMLEATLAMRRASEAEAAKRASKK